MLRGGEIPIFENPWKTAADPKEHSRQNHQQRQRGAGVVFAFFYVFVEQAGGSGDSGPVVYGVGGR